jgi:hypothetical protein
MVPKYVRDNWCLDERSMEIFTSDLVSYGSYWAFFVFVVVSLRIDGDWLFIFLFCCSFGFDFFDWFWRGGGAHCPADPCSYC